MRSAGQPQQRRHPAIARGSAPCQLITGVCTRSRTRRRRIVWPDPPAAV